MTRALAIVLALVVSGCAGGAGLTADLRARLASADTRTARERAPDLVGEAEAALADAEDAERSGDREAAADHVTRARLLLEAAQAEATRIEAEQERRGVEERLAGVLARARHDEQAREEIDLELARAASARAAREEVLRALAQAEADEARPPRRGRVSLEEAQDMRRAAAALRARAELTTGAARAIGASEDALRPVTDALAASENERADPIAALDAADRAHREALRALGAARRALDAPGPDAALELAEAARSEGFEALALSEGTAIEAEGVFSGSAIGRDASGRVQRLASLIAAHPFGPVQVQAQVASGGRRGDQLAAHRAEALRRALVQAGADASRLSASAVPSALAAETPVDRARLVFVGYAPTP